MSKGSWQSVVRGRLPGRPHYAISLNSGPSNEKLKRYSCSFLNMISAASGSAARLINLLARDFACFRDEHDFEGSNIRILKRAQILVADLWACFNGESYGKFGDIHKITMFADYRIPQLLISLGALYCSPPVVAAIKRKDILESGSKWEVQLRGKKSNP